MYIGTWYVVFKGTNDDVPSHSSRSLFDVDYLSVKPRTGKPRELGQDGISKHIMWRLFKSCNVTMTSKGRRFGSLERTLDNKESTLCAVFQDGIVSSLSYLLHWKRSRRESRDSELSRTHSVFGCRKIPTLNVDVEVNCCH